MSDTKLRKLERAAYSGDIDSGKKLIAERFRLGLPLLKVKEHIICGWWKRPCIVVGDEERGYYDIYDPEYDSYLYFKVLSWMGIPLESIAVVGYGYEVK